jgi:hypothetical protein
MPHTFEDAFALVQSLAKDFEANKAQFLSPACRESEARKDFIDKFLIALGWDINHDWQKSPFEQKVIYFNPCSTAPLTANHGYE